MGKIVCAARKAYSDLCPAEVGLMKILFNHAGSGKIPGKLTLHITGPAYKYYRIFFSGDVMPDFHLWAADTLAIPLDLNSRLY